LPDGIAFPFTSRIEGTRGEIWIPSIGVLVAEMKRPVLLRRRGDTGPNEGQFDLHAAVSYFNDALWTDKDFEKEFTVYVGKQPLKVEILPTTKVIKADQSLRMEGVKVQ
jgi:hypothetical protein